MSQLSPAKEIVAKLGGVRATARVLQLNPSAVSRWMMPPKKRGTGGLIPQRHWPAILEHARKERLKLRLADLVNLPK
jgi:hypothetical protein